MVQNNKLDYIDALRGFAILLVIFAHTGQMFPKDYPQLLKDFYSFGPRGVQLFFIISSLTLFLSSERRFTTDSRPYLHFFMRRFFRIAPLYYIGLIFYSIIHYSSVHVTVGRVVSSVFFISTINPYWNWNSLVPGGWSISCEMIFYLFVPILFTRLKSLNNAAWFTVIMLSISLFFHALLNVFNFGIDEKVWNTFPPYIFPVAAPVFGIGMCFYFIIFKRDSYINPILITIISLIILLGTILNSGFLNIYLQATIFGIIAYSQAIKSNIIIVNKISIFFGKISYSMYISHFIIVETIENLGILNIIPSYNSKWLFIYFLTKFVVILFFSSIISMVLHWAIEIPGQNLGKLLIKLTTKKY